MHGVLNLDKPRGLTSYQAVERLKGLLHNLKVGHAGTLDPEATGVLPICLGRGTRIFPYLLLCDKHYRARMRLGVTTDTQDATGRPIRVRPVPELRSDEVERAVLEFVGTIGQTPPMFSSLKLEGRRLYEIARTGVEVERKPRKVKINEMKVKAVLGDEMELEVVCSRGTYIRTLCHDLGERLGVGGHLVELVRLRLGPFCLQQAISLQVMEGLTREGRLDEVLIPIDAALSFLPRVDVTERTAELVRRGGAITLEGLEELPGSLRAGDPVRVYERGGGFLATAEALRDFPLEVSDGPQKALFRTRRVFAL